MARTHRQTVEAEPLQEPSDVTLADLDLEAQLDLRPKVDAAPAHHAMARRIGAGLDQAKNNNDRHEVLTQLKEDVLPHYDDLPTVYPEIRDKLKEAWVLARNTETVPHETPFGSFEGTEPYQVTAQIANIIEQYWPLDGPEEAYILIRDSRYPTRSRKRQESRFPDLGGIHPEMLCPPWRCRARTSVARPDARNSGLLLSRTACLLLTRT